MKNISEYSEQEGMHQQLTELAQEKYQRAPVIVRPLADLLSSSEDESGEDGGEDTARGDTDDLGQLLSPGGKRRRSAGEESGQSYLNLTAANNQTSSAQWHRDTNYDEDEYTMDLTAGGTSYLSKKKMQYLEQRISDRTGSYSYAEDPTLYKKARKRLQNRESAIRSRMRKRRQLEGLEEQVRKLQAQNRKIEQANEHLRVQNQQWELLFRTTRQRQNVAVDGEINNNNHHEKEEDMSCCMLSHGAADQYDEISFVSLKMQSDRGTKRQKRSSSLSVHVLDGDDGDDSMHKEIGGGASLRLDDCDDDVTSYNRMSSSLRRPAPLVVQLQSSLGSLEAEQPTGHSSCGKMQLQPQHFQVERNFLERGTTLTAQRPKPASTRGLTTTQPMTGCLFFSSGASAQH